MPHTVDAISGKELNQVRSAYESLRASMKGSMDEMDKTNIKKAYNLAVDAHMYQRRKSGEPYVLHPIEVARICFEEIGLGPTAVVCAILHDVVEDTEVTLEDIQEEFGDKITLIVDGLTKLDGLYNVESPQAENLKKVLSTLVYDVRVVLIKMADRLHNLRTISSMPRNKQLRIAAETSYIYVPLCHRLGLYSVKTEFEDICMQINEPETYEELREKLAQNETERNAYIEDFIEPIRQKLDGLNLPYKVIGRPKTIFSIWNKIRKKKVAFDEIYDLFAIRIIADVPRAEEKMVCWQIYSLITDVYKPIAERLKDWITNPKGNGYESLHTSVVGPNGRYVEIQIRSVRMDEIAEKGFAAHWKYKGVKNDQNVYDKWLENIRDILENKHASAIEFLNDFRSNLFKEEVYLYTPSGEMKILPKGATALDFAFNIHSDVGYHATAIKVNNKLVPMGYKLNNGDQVHVTTNNSQKPTEDWLKLVVTGKARSKIRSAMKEEMKKRGEIGKETLMRKMKKLKANFEENIDMLVKHFGFRSRPELFYNIAQDNVKLSELKNFKTIGRQLILIKNKAITAHQKEDKEWLAPIQTKNHQDGKDLILIAGEPASKYSFSLSRCCNPVSGDDIFAFLSISSGMKIHRSNCPNATHLMAKYGYRLLKAEWSGSTMRNFVVELLLTGVDSGPGVIQRLTNEISNNLGVNIRSFSIEGREGYFEGKVSLVVKDKNQLVMIMRSLEKMDGIARVERINKSMT